ncbi:hypothetical protein NQ318_018585 [Aromia moschata]|uniref:Maturase K n=1 Tax=Aromia moschata TaxID=1265417 RepID=A0AAV8ZGM0_9CUCU|nr:hypothetical protein NQ318_018585 [Aromia moschata]
MSKFETEVKNKFEYFPRVWFRYVDEIFAVFDTNAISLDNFVAKLNNRFLTIKYTYEMEHNEQLLFLDVLVIRNSENMLDFDVYRKETATLRYIPNDLHHPFQHKMASFNFLIYRLLNFPLSNERFEHEKQLIKNIAKNNAYTLIKSHILYKKSVWVGDPLKCCVVPMLRNGDARISNSTSRHWHYIPLQRKTIQYNFFTGDRIGAWNVSPDAPLSLYPARPAAISEKRGEKRADLICQSRVGSGARGKAAGQIAARGGAHNVSISVLGPHPSPSAVLGPPPDDSGL